MAQADSSPAIRIGTRGSELALWQANHVASLIRARHPELAVDLRVIPTAGDRGAGAPPWTDGENGLFTNEIDRALAAGAIDLAVHSLKDLPTALAEGLAIAAVIEREDPRDVLVGPPGATLATLAPGCRVGTASLRRRAQVMAANPHVRVVEIRGNVPTRLARLDRGEVEAIVLARAGVARLGLDHRISAVLDAGTMLPAPGQGALAVEARADDRRMLDLAGELDHLPARLATTAERAMLARLEGGCQVPVGALASLDGDVLRLDGLIADLDGTRLVRGSESATVNSDHEAESIGGRLALRLLESGGADVLGDVRRRARVSGNPGNTRP